MSKNDSQPHITSSALAQVLKYAVKWFCLSACAGILAGTASAIFLASLDWVTNFRESHLWIIALLPLAGVLIGSAYYYRGEEVVKGNNLLLEEYQNPQKIIPLRMAPMVLLGTLVTHLFGGSAGREGTAVQMATAISDQFSRFFKSELGDRRILILMGISAGFASVFGTPWAGAVFAIEILFWSKVNYKAIIPVLLSALIADYTCTAWNISHTHYTIQTVPEISLQNIFTAAFAGIIFGLCAWLFSGSNRFWANTFKSIVQFAPLRPVIGGVCIAIAVWLLGSTRYIGLGVPIIQQAFTENLNSYDFLLKILFTTFTIGAGFKGGEVTPLFYIGATLGNVLFWIVPLPMGLLAGMGFVAVFAGTTNTPLACTIMGTELFGAESLPFIATACFVSYLFSGPAGIYSSQQTGGLKLSIYQRLGLIKKQSSLITSPGRI